jgi:superfamily II DNA/RNA helicase
MKFTDLSLPPELIAALAKQQISEPTPIQIAAIPPLAAGKDAYLRAETGTGKTLAYLLPLFTRIDPAQAATQVVIVAPSHELAIQIHRQSCELALNAARAIRSVLLIGGTATARQIDKLKAKPHVVVGSPGRIVELVERGKLKMAHIRAVVIDEADRLLNDESLNWIQQIVSAAAPARQLIFASATIEQQTRHVLETLAPDVVMLRAGAAAVNENIEHLYLVCESRDKPDVLRKLLHAFDVPRSIVFVHRNDVAEEVASKLSHHKLAVADLNSELSKVDRKKAMDGIRSGTIRIMIASDLAARGLNVPGVTHIFNLDIPTMSKAYLHRVGRTARAGAHGTAVSLVTESQARLIRRYEQDLGISLQCIRFVTAKSVPRPSRTDHNQSIRAYLQRYADKLWHCHRPGSGVPARGHACHGRFGARALGGHQPSQRPTRIDRIERVTGHQGKQRRVGIQRDARPATIDNPNVGDDEHGSAAVQRFNSDAVAGLCRAQHLEMRVAMTFNYTVAKRSGSDACRIMHRAECEIAPARTLQHDQCGRRSSLAHGQLCNGPCVSPGPRHGNL